MMTAELIAMGTLWLLFLLDLTLELVRVRRRGRAHMLRNAGGLTMLSSALMMTLAQQLGVGWLVLGFLLGLAGLGCSLLSHTSVSKPKPSADLRDGTNNQPGN